MRSSKSPFPGLCTDRQRKDCGILGWGPKRIVCVCLHWALGGAGEFGQLMSRYSYVGVFGTSICRMYYAHVHLYASVCLSRQNPLVYNLLLRFAQLCGSAKVLLWALFKAYSAYSRPIMSLLRTQVGLLERSVVDPRNKHMLSSRGVRVCLGTWKVEQRFDQVPIITAALQAGKKDAQTPETFRSSSVFLTPLVGTIECKCLVTSSDMLPAKNRKV